MRKSSASGHNNCESVFPGIGGKLMECEPDGFAP
jgi:hypothetical protein